MAVEVAPRITMDPKVRFGKPVIKGTRVPVEIVVGKLAGGMSVEEVAREYGITEEDVRAALQYAARLSSTEEVKALHSQLRWEGELDQLRAGRFVQREFEEIRS